MKGPRTASNKPLHLERAAAAGVSINTIKPPRRIKFPLVLLLIFISIQLILFMTLDLPRLVRAAATASRSQGQSDNSGTASGLNSVLQATLGLSLQSDSKPPVLSDGPFTSILIAGIDARNVELKNGEFINTKPEGQAGTRNVDSIMQVVYDYRDNQVFLISIPRDSGVDVRLDCFHFSGSINQIYDKGEYSSCPNKGIDALETAVESMTGIKINYYAMITLDAFQKIIDAVGQKGPGGENGIYVDNPNGFSEIYPDDNQVSWDGVYFPKGHLFLNSLRALQFARSRQFTTDFGRASRQQLVVEGAINSLLSANTLFDPAKIMNLINVFNSSVLMSKPQDLNELMGMISLAKSADLKNIHRMVLDPDFGNAGNSAYIKKQPNGRPGYYMTPVAWKDCPGNEYCQVQSRIRAFIDDPGLM